MTCWNSGLRTTSWTLWPMATPAVGPKQTYRSLVHRDDSLVRVDGDDAFSHAGEDCLALVALAGQRADLVVDLLRHGVQASCDLRELLSARHAQFLAEVADRETACAFGNLPHLAAESS